MSRYSTSGGGIARTFEGSSLETIRHMVASGIGITVLPKASVPASAGADDILRYLPFDNPPPSRRVVIAWRKSFTRQGAIDAIRKIVLSCTLNGVTMLPEARQAEH
jgi:LysR family hydrogen peroxide-inducible transcriptional activator